MLDKIKQWTARVLDWNLPVPGTEPDAACGAESLESTLRGLQPQECPLDPRELPRPHRSHDPEISSVVCENGSGSGSGAEDDAGTGSWCCRNCAHLSLHLLECAICLEPLSARARGGVTSCVECGNVACVECARRLPRCPYCRAEPGLTANLALQRLVYKLNIPYSNSILPVRCPHRKCEWRGDIDRLASHLEQVHLVTILRGSSVTLDIADFHRKAELSETRARHYSVILSCYSDVFVCKVVLHHSKLKVVLSQLSRARHIQLAAWAEISCPSKTTKGIIPLSKTKSEFVVPVAHFVSPVKGNSDRVSISINIRALKIS